MEGRRPHPAFGCPSPALPAPQAARPPQERAEVLALGASSFCKKGVRTEWTVSSLILADWVFHFPASSSIGPLMGWVLWFYGRGFGWEV